MDLGRLGRTLQEGYEARGRMSCPVDGEIRLSAGMLTKSPRLMRCPVFDGARCNGGSGKLRRLLQAEAPGLALPQADAQLGRVLRDAVHLLAHLVEAVFGLASDSAGRCRVSSISRRIAEYQSAAVACCAARSEKRRKVWSAARIATRMLIAPTAQARGPKTAVPTTLAKTTAGTPTM